MDPHNTHAKKRKARALVAGDISLVRALGRTGIDVVVATDRSVSPATASRFCKDALVVPSFLEDPDGAVDAIVAWCKREPAKPVLFYQGDHDLLAFSRRRADLEGCAHIVLPRAELVEDLVDKVRFAALAERVHLPVPKTGVLGDEWTLFPCVLKPATRSHPLAGAAKAVRIEGPSELIRAAAVVDARCVIQEAIPGREDRIVSYHAYVRADGSVAAEFTGKKVRTIPKRYGFSTCVMVAHDAEVAFAGREVMRAIELTGVVKMDFKRDARDGRLVLLEINPRFNLWHHPATIAGVAIPELVYRDCVDGDHAERTKHIAREIVWMNTRGDARSFLEHRRDGELSTWRWLSEVVGADVREDFWLADPLPFLVDVAEHVAARWRNRA